MSKREEYEAKTEELLLPVLEALHFELWDVEYVKEGSEYYLRAYIDKEGGITIDDCVTVSRQLSDLLDEADFIPDAYILEVSSPGLGRKLVKDRDFDRSIGKSVDLKTYKPVDGVKEFTGILRSYDRERIVVETNGQDTPFQRSDVAVVKLSVIL
ncbi:MAG: ribosome maturation factor RimP [Lachnospiraceae bacterium]|nr:ribosome maturation factor RimP [Lachnospiraceae bacterium]